MPSHQLVGMCNLYSQKKSQAEIRDLAKAMVDHAGNMPSLPAIFPDGMAPVVRTMADGQRELVMMRCGFPAPKLPGTKPRSPYLINTRNMYSYYWLPWLRGTEYRCLVPVTSFAEPDNNQGPKSIWTWFVRAASLRQWQPRAEIFSRSRGASLAANESDAVERQARASPKDRRQKARATMAPGQGWYRLRCRPPTRCC